MTGTFLKENKSPDSLFPASLLQSKAMLMREVKPFPSLPAAQAATFISPDKIKKPNPKLLEQACIFPFAQPVCPFLGRKTPPGAGFTRGDALVFPYCPCCLQGSAGMLDPVRCCLRGHLGGVLGTSWASCPQGGLGAQQHTERGCWQCLPAGITSCRKKLFLE